jgi:hypothetical protein
MRGAPNSKLFIITAITTRVSLFDSKHVQSHHQQHTWTVGVEAGMLEGDQTLLPQTLRHALHRRPTVRQPHLLVELVRQVAVGVEKLRPAEK